MNNLKLSGMLTRNLEHSAIESLIKTTSLHTGELLCEAGEEREVYSDEKAFLEDLPNIMAKGYSMMYAGVICRTYQEYQQAVNDWTSKK